jgi:predicted secreted hydrolase
MPSVGIDLTLTATFVDQEFVTLIAKPGFWEGRVEVAGTWGGAPVAGVGNTTCMFGCAEGLPVG